MTHAWIPAIWRLRMKIGKLRLACATKCVQGQFGPYKRIVFQKFIKTNKKPQEDDKANIWCLKFRDWLPQCNKYSCRNYCLIGQ